MPAPFSVATGMKVLSLLQDPRNKGGVATVTHWYRRWMDLHRPAERVERYLDDASSRRLFLHRKNWNHQFESIPRVLPLLHVPQYYAGRRWLRNLAAEAEETHVLGGVAVHATMGNPHVPSIIWIGTTIRDERKRVAPHQTKPRRMSHTLTLPLLHHMEFRALNHAHKILAQSHHTADQLVRGGIQHQLIEIQPVPIDTSYFAPDDQPRAGILFVGRASDPRKNIGLTLQLLTASAHARAEGLDVVSADRPEPSAADRNLPNLRWWGSVNDLGEKYRRAKILVMSSRQEGLGIVVFEGLASGTPVVAMRCGGPDRYLIESGGGFVVDSPEDFRAAVDRLLENPELGREMGMAGRAWVEQNISARAFLENTHLFRIA